MDIDEDGNLDILSGTYACDDETAAGLYQVLYGTKDGGFKKIAVLNGTDGKPLVITPGHRVENYCTRPFAVDWDGDGDLDLIVGNLKGAFYLFTGEGKGKFAPKPSVIKTGETILRVNGGRHGDPFIVDWDGDGDLDLLSGSRAGGVQLAVNSAGPGKEPKLAPFECLIPDPKNALGSGGETPGGATRVWADDFNGDGKLDILVGDLQRSMRRGAGGAQSGFVWLYIQK